MMSTFEFELADAEARSFCEEVVEEICRQFGVSRENAMRLVNVQWHGMRIGGPG